MQCHQCNNNAIYQVGEKKVPLCLNCYAVMQQVTERNIQILREEMNHSMDSIDSIFGISVGARYPIKRPVLLPGGTVNHISINNSPIGILNTGNIQNINQTIDSLYSISQKDIADNIKNFSQTVISTNELNQEQKNQILESLDIIIKELFVKPENRKKTLVNSLFNQVSDLVNLSASSVTLWQLLHPLLQTFFK